MEIKAYGFEIKQKSLPSAFGIEQLFLAIENCSGKPVDSQSLLRIAAGKVSIKFNKQEEEWWAGMVVRAKDVKSFNKIVEDGGKLTLTSEMLKDGKMADVSCYICHPKSGRGLLSVYHTGPSLRLFEVILKRTFRRDRRFSRERALRAATTESKKSIRESYAGALFFSQLVHEGDLKGLLKTLKTTSTVEARFSDNVLRKKIFGKLERKSSTKVVQFKFPPAFSLDDELIDEIVKADRENPSLFARVKGVGEDGEPLIINSDLTPRLVFGSVDYDKMLGDIKLDLNDWQPVIRDSPLIKWLLELTFNKETRSKLI